MVLKNLRIENFRSVRNSTVSFSDSGLTVLIGANGSGKSNLVRALHFVSQLASDGMDSALRAHGGGPSLIPKVMPKGRLRAASTRMAYDVELTRPEWYPEDAASPSGGHEFEIFWERGGGYHMGIETLRFSEPLLVARMYQVARDKKLQDDSTAFAGVPRETEITVHRSRRNNISVRSQPTFRRENVGMFLEWLGLETFEDRVASGTQLREFLKRWFTQMLDRGGVSKQRSMIESGALPPMALWPQASAFRGLTENIEHFDFELTELRSEQPVAVATQLDTRGRYLPSALRRIGDKDPDAIGRIRETLKIIAPHVTRTKTEALRSGKEYVEFIETQGGRPVESWDTSDGTLRALAILVALETRSSHSIVVIEEPERGLHPWAVRGLMDHVRTAVNDRKIQVVLTTHSQQVLEEMHPEEVLLTTRTDEEGTRFRPLLECLPKGSDTKRGDIGRMWVKGLLGAIPGDG